MAAGCGRGGGALCPEPGFWGRRLPAWGVRSGAFCRLGAGRGSWREGVPAGAGAAVPAGALGVRPVRVGASGPETEGAVP
ncbi:hypothetical protein GCM10010495_52410 [Kitasatospora herbaricolor]|nr:hypothetical protein GCM10010495_52410 [Kitasatospora herbaricolor]